MAIWRDDDPPFNIGRMRESVLGRRVYRLRRLCKRRPGRFEEQLEKAIDDLVREMDFNNQIDLM
jgi:hypothetical protein